jgi:hypothetical protein
MQRRVTLHLDYPLCSCRTPTGLPPFAWSFGAPGITVKCPECKVEIHFPRQSLVAGVAYSNWQLEEQGPRAEPGKLVLLRRGGEE